MPPRSGPVIGTDRSVVDTVVDMVARGAYRQARLQLIFHERRSGLEGVAEQIAHLTSPPADVDPRIEPIASANVPARLPDWLAPATRDEVVRVCARQSMRDSKVDTLIARLLAAAIVDESVPVAEPHRLPHRPEVDLRDGSGAIHLSSAPDRGPDWTDPDTVRRPDRSLTDWLARKV